MGYGQEAIHPLRGIIRQTINLHKRRLSQSFVRQYAVAQKNKQSRQL